VILDSTFLVDFERECERGIKGPATRFLEQNPAEPLMITFTIAGELAAGALLVRDRTRNADDFVRITDLDVRRY